MRKKALRSGYTTGACAAAAAKAATIQLLSSEFGVKGSNNIKTVDIPFPDGSRVKFKVHSSKLITHALAPPVGNSELVGWASVIKDAGDDPDVTNGAEIVAEAKIVRKIGSAEERKDRKKLNSVTSELPGFQSSALIIRGGKGVGVVTKPGLALPVGEAAINPVPRKMITEAVAEAITDSINSGLITHDSKLSLEVTISVPDGEKLAKKTLNYRLGIVGGISILGTTGIVRPISSEAWTATITSSMNVAKAMGHKEIILSAGRTSEKAHMKKYNFPEESYVMMGDYLEFSLLEAKKHGFRKIHLCAQWAKMLKIAMATPQTHVRHGAIDVKKAKELLISLGIQNPEFRTRNFNTAREIFDFLNSSLIPHPSSLLLKVCSAAAEYAKGIAGTPVKSHLISYEGDIIAVS